MIIVIFGEYLFDPSKLAESRIFTLPMILSERIISNQPMKKDKSLTNLLLQMNRYKWVNYIIWP